MTTPQRRLRLWQDAACCWVGVATIPAAILAVIANLNGTLRPYREQFASAAFGAAVVAVGLGTWAMVRRRLRRRGGQNEPPLEGSVEHLYIGMSIGVMGVVGGCLVFPQIVMISEAASRIQISNNLHQIGVALQKYASDHGGQLPPAAAVNERGERLLSWRVLLLPYLDQQALYKEFHLDEPWDGLHNAALLARMPDVYASSRLYPAPPNHTHFQVLVGPGTAFERDGLRLIPEDFPDGLDNTVLVAEGAEAVPWTKPEDIPFRPGELPRFRTTDDDLRFSFVFADGSVRQYMPRYTSEETILGAITRNGGEKIDK